LRCSRRGFLFDLSFTNLFVVAFQLLPLLRDGDALLLQDLDELLVEVDLVASQLVLDVRAEDADPLLLDGAGSPRGQAHLGPETPFPVGLGLVLLVAGVGARVRRDVSPVGVGGGRREFFLVHQVLPIIVITVRQLVVVFRIRRVRRDRHVVVERHPLGTHVYDLLHGRRQRVGRDLPRDLGAGLLVLQLLQLLVPGHLLPLALALFDPLHDGLHRVRRVLQALLLPPLIKQSVLSSQWVFVVPVGLSRRLPNQHLGVGAEDLLPAPALHFFIFTRPKIIN
jgi:hypothetical protein